MRVAVLGSTGRTGRAAVAELVRRGHDVVVLARDAARAPEGVARVVVGDARDREALEDLLTGADAVLSALGPAKGDRTLHRDVAAVLVPAMQERGVRRFVGVSGAGVDVPGDRKSTRDRIISGAMHLLTRPVVADKEGEHRLWAASGLDWTLVRPPRLADGEATGRVEHHAEVSTRSTRMLRGDLAVFLADELEAPRYAGRAPFVATGSDPR